VYSPDGRQVTLAQWRERPVQQIEAFIRPMPSGDGTAAGTQSDRVMRTLDLGLIRRALPYPVAPIELVQLGDTSPSGSVPPRLTPPPPDEGSHKSYAFQWFSFATIAVVGAVLFAINDRRRA
jgi:surfeit locus 1 family protein